MSSKKGIKKNTGNASEIFSEKISSLDIDPKVISSHQASETTNVITNTKKSILSLNIMKYLPIITIIALLLIWWYFEKSLYKIQMGISSSNKKYENKIESIDHHLSKLLQQNNSFDDNIIHQERIINLIKKLENENIDENKEDIQNETIIMNAIPSKLKLNNLKSSEDNSEDHKNTTEITQEHKEPNILVEPKIQLHLEQQSPDVTVDVEFNATKEQIVSTNTNEDKVSEFALDNNLNKFNNNSNSNIIVEKNGKQLTLGDHLKGSLNNMKHVDQLVSPRVIEMS